MKKFLRSIFKGTVPEAAEPELEASESPAAPSNSSAPGSAIDPGDVIADLKEFIQSTIPDPISLDEIDPMMHLYDAGYVTSISAADLLAHIDSKYGVDVSETQLIGRLQNLDALARHVVAKEA